MAKKSVFSKCVWGFHAMSVLLRNNFSFSSSSTCYYSVPAIVRLQIMALVMLLPTLNVLYLYISTFRSMCAVPNMAVVCSSLIDFVFARRGAQLLSEWFRDGSGCLCYYWYHSYFCIPRAQYFYC